MEIEPISDVSAAAAPDAVVVVAPVDESATVEAQRPFTQATNARTCTGFDPQACIPDLHGQGIAAAAAAQDHRVFVRRRTSA